MQFRPLSGFPSFIKNPSQAAAVLLSYPLNYS
jgi:hypothetical protein